MDVFSFSTELTLVALVDMSEGGVIGGSKVGLTEKSTLIKKKLW